MRLESMVTLVVVLGATLTSVVVAFAGGPLTLDDVVREVERMRDSGASNEAIARYVTDVVDERIVNGNSFEGDLARYQGYYSGDEAIFDRWAQFENERELIEEDPGREYLARAEWAWDLRYGHCAEASAIAYYIFRHAEIPARIFEVPGHSFTVMGVPEDADGSDAASWGSDAYVVDPWYGRAVRADSIEGWVWNRWGSPSDDRRSDVTELYDSDFRYELSHPDDDEDDEMQPEPPSSTRFTFTMSFRNRGSSAVYFHVRYYRDNLSSTPPYQVVPVYPYETIQWVGPVPPGGDVAAEFTQDICDQFTIAVVESMTDALPIVETVCPFIKTDPPSALSTHDPNSDVSLCEGFGSAASVTCL